MKHIILTQRCNNEATADQIHSTQYAEAQQALSGQLGPKNGFVWRPCICMLPQKTTSACYAITHMPPYLGVCRLSAPEG
jgi:hypothetical protein